MGIVQILVALMHEIKSMFVVMHRVPRIAQPSDLPTKAVVVYCLVREFSVYSALFPLPTFKPSP
jgi:hypothetical protein